MAIIKLDRSPVAQLWNNIIVIVSCIQNLLLFCYHTYHILTKDKPHYLQTISICRCIVVVAVVCYQTTKVTFWLVFLERLFIVFESSKFRFKSYHIVTSRIFLAVIAVANNTIIIIGLNAYHNKFTNSCKAHTPMWMTFLFASTDIFICSSLAILFARRFLLATLATQNDMKQQKNDEITKTDSNIEVALKKDEEMWSMLRKATLLSSIALITTPLLLICVGIFGLTALFGCADGIINCYCIMLMFQVHHKLFSILCGRLQSCVTIKCLSCFSCHLCCPIIVNNKLELKEPQTQSHTI
eukprot:219620_1